MRRAADAASRSRAPPRDVITRAAARRWALEQSGRRAAAAGVRGGLGGARGCLPASAPVGSRRRAVRLGTRWRRSPRSAAARDAPRRRRRRRSAAAAVAAVTLVVHLALDHLQERAKAQYSCTRTTRSASKMRSWKRTTGERVVGGGFAEDGADDVAPSLVVEAARRHHLRGAARCVVAHDVHDAERALAQDACVGLVVLVRERATG